MTSAAPGETLSNQPPPDDRPEAPRPVDPAAPPPVTPDGTSAPVPGQPWSTPSGDFLSPGADQPPPGPPSYQPGYASPPTSQFPVVPPAPDHGYVQPGYPPPGYGPPPGYSPPPGYGPPQPPPRKSNAPLIAVIIAVALLLCGGVATAGIMITRAATEKAREAVKPLTDPAFPTGLPDLPTDIPDLPGLPTDLPTDLPTAADGRQASVTYEVTGDGPVQIFYLERVDAPTRLKDVSLPWKLTKTMSVPAVLSVTAVRLTGDSGTVSCRTLVDGKEIAQKSNTGSYGTVSCNSFVPE